MNQNQPPQLTKVAKAGLKLRAGEHQLLPGPCPWPDRLRSGGPEPPAEPAKESAGGRLETSPRLLCPTIARPAPGAVASGLQRLQAQGSSWAYGLHLHSHLPQMLPEAPAVFEVFTPGQWGPREPRQAGTRSISDVPTKFAGLSLGLGPA